MNAQVYDNPQEIQLFRLKALRGAIKLESLGMKRRGQSAYSIAKQELGLTGNRNKVLDQLNTIIKAHEQSLAR
tara:strand:+ start:274 stop:492 length:219 start_codon:yes stop_codon:yes gene_type:complete